MEVAHYVHQYVRVLKELNTLESYEVKKIHKIIIHFLEEIPTMSFLYEVQTAFGKVEKKLCLNEAFILGDSTNDMIPLYQKVIEKMETLKKEAESKKLF